MKNTILTFAEAKRNGTKLAMLTAYDYTMAKLMDASGVNGILVGDSVGMVSLGYRDTLPVTMDDMVHHTKAVAKDVGNALLVADMPFMSYQTSVRDAIYNAGRLIKEGNAHAVKLEGGRETCPQIRAIVDAYVPVMGHVGMTPQAVNMFGGFKIQGREEASARKIMEDAKAVEDAGAFAVVLECIPAQLAEIITRSLSIPTIGIGAGKSCDGQILVYADMLGMFEELTPKFAKVYADIGGQIRKAFAEYVNEVRRGEFPSPDHAFTLPDDIVKKF
ncbi:MAG: 3-methyl-2-oxobutanoate hydroxymethyltransferase [Desulfovibrio sp.]|jgi:3-methyl-2-oxobutanoate hydroxymethyltransferase|nr:3-methyl-2-oxobutanoate hydroxymethyltransferase [Desulfovibrio sp.]